MIIQKQMYIYGYPEFDLTIHKDGIDNSIRYAGIEEANYETVEEIEEELEKSIEVEDIDVNDVLPSII